MANLVDDAVARDTQKKRERETERAKKKEHTKERQTDRQQERKQIKYTRQKETIQKERLKGRYTV